MFNRKLKILMVQTMNMNLGDSVLADNDCYLMKKAMGFKRCDLLRYSISSRDFTQVKYVDAVVFAGGIIKCTNENFWQYMPEIINEANKYNVPVFLSAIGVEQFYPDDPRSVELKKAINLPCVKGISVRDDIETLRRDYLTNKNIRTYSVYDPAVWCADTYKKYIVKKSDKAELVGLGITREKLFSDYGNPQIDRQFQLDLWKGIINELDNLKVEWKVFTNGDTYDEIFAKEVLAYCGKSTDKKLPAPLNATDLVATVSMFTSVIAGRMHSNIIAYSLGIPSIGFVWNRKLRFWGEKIGYPQRFIECSELSCDNVISEWKKATVQGCTLNSEFKRSVYNALVDFAKIIRYRHKDHEKLDFASHMVASSLGGIEIRYKSTNSKQAFEYSHNLGYQNLHVDMRLTCDNRLVCVSKWHKDTYRIMNHPKKEEDKPSAVSYDEFMTLKYYNRFDTMDVDDLFDLCDQHFRKNHRLIISFGKPDKASFALITDQLKSALERHNLSTDSILFRLEQKRDIEHIRKAFPDADIIYHATGSKPDVQQTLPVLTAALEYCKKYKIRYIYISNNVYEEEYRKLCEEYGVKFYSGTCVRTDKIINNIKNGAHFVGSQYYDVNYLKRLTK